MLFTDRKVALSRAQTTARDSLNASMRLAHVPCLCGGTSFHGLSRHDRYGLKQPTVICRACGLMQLNPRMSADAYRAFYESDAYRLLYDGERFVAQYRAMMTVSQGAKILQAVGRAPGGVVEIGAGAGWNLVAFKAAGWQVVGYDYSEALTALGRECAIDMRRGSIAQALDTGERYDLIVLNHVLEHFLDPVAELRALHGLLAPGGSLYVGVPSTNYPLMGLLQNAHTYYFTAHTLRHYLARAGWASDSVTEVWPIDMHTIARAGDIEPPSLNRECVEQLAKLKANRRNAYFIEWRDRLQTVVTAIARRLGLYESLRNFYRRAH